MNSAGKKIGAWGELCNSDSGSTKNGDNYG